MNNAVFGKTMGNLRNRRYITLVNNRHKLMKLVAEPSFKGFKIFHKDLIAVERAKVELLLNRPITIGFSILDISKTLMYRFHYDYIKQKYEGNKSQLLFTDTDSLVYSIKVDNLYDDMYEDKNEFDFNGYLNNSPYYNVENKKKIGKMKDGMGGILIKEFVGLRAKMYFVLSPNLKEKKKTKDIKKNVVKNHIKHSDYVNCLLNEIHCTHTMTLIRSTNYQLLTIEQNKKSLTPYDDKRYLLDDSNHTLPYRHYKIKRK